MSTETPLYGFGGEYAREGHIVAFPASGRTALCGVALNWIPANQFAPESVHPACRAALEEGAQAAYPDAWADDDTDPKDTK